MASQLWGYSPPSFKQSWFGGNGLCVLPGSLSNTKKTCITLHQPPWSCHSWKQRCLSPVHQIHRDDFPGALGVWFQMFQISTRWVLQLQKFGTCDWPSRCFLQSENRYRLPFLSCHENSINFTCQMGGQGCQEWKTCQHQWLRCHPPASTGTENSPGECKGGPPGEYGIQRQTIPGRQYVTARNSKPNHPNPKPPHLYCHIVILSCSGITPRSIKRIEMVSLFMSWRLRSQVTPRDVVEQIQHADPSSSWVASWGPPKHGVTLPKACHQLTNKKKTGKFLIFSCCTLASQKSVYVLSCWTFRMF